MKRSVILIAILVLSLVVMCGLAGAVETGARQLSGWLSVTTPDGWVGKRYVEKNVVFAEEFDSNGDGRMDIWRFYRRGILSSEERDLNHDGKVDFQSRWEPNQRRLVTVLRDSEFRGVNDLEIESLGARRWEIREDRNHDGITDRILTVNGPPELFDILGIDIYTETNVIDSIPVTYWDELASDDYFYGVITDYRRYSRGRLTHYGQWNGRQVAWNRCPPDFVPPEPDIPRPELATVQPTQPFQPEPGMVDTVGPVYTDEPYVTGTDPFATPYSDPYTDPYAATPQPGYVDPFATTAPVMTDRTRYEGLPPGDSAARSLPARMRPPGVGPSR